MLLNPSLFNYNIGDRVVMLGIVHEYHGDGETRPIAGGGVSREHLRREGKLALIEGYVNFTSKGNVHISYHAWPENDDRRRDYGRYSGDFSISNRSVQAAVTVLQAYPQYFGQPDRLTPEQFEYAEQFLYPVPIASANYLRLLSDVRAAAGIEGIVSIKDLEQVRAEAQRLGIPVMTYPYEEYDVRVDGITRTAVSNIVDAYNEARAAADVRAQIQGVAA